MRSTIEIDDRLLKEAMSLTRAKTKKETVRISLECVIRKMRREKLKEKLGKFPLELTGEALRKMREEQ